MPSCCVVKKPPLACCAPENDAPKKTTSWPIWKKLEVVCAVALCAFAAYVNWTTFAVSLAVGATYQLLKIACKMEQKGKGDQRPGCGQGFGELIAQIPLLSPEIVLATSYVAWRHIVHDPQGFVPFVGFFVGMGIAHYTHAQLIHRKTT